MARKKNDATDTDAVTHQTDAADATPRPEPADEAAGPDVPGPGSASEPVAVTEAPEASGMGGDAAPAAAEPRAVPEPEPAPAPADTRHEHEEYHEEESGMSFAARALLFLLILLAGAALGIWGAPRLAPMLPSGMAPVAGWLTPGGEAAQQRVAGLEAELEAEIAGLRARIDEIAGGEDVDARIAAAIGGAEERSGAQLEELRTALADLGGDETSQRLARLESALEGQVTELDTLQEQISGGVAQTSELTEEAVAQIDVYRSELEGLRAELGSLSDTVASLRNRIDEVAATADRSIESAEARVAEVEAEASSALSDAAVEANVAQIRAALAAGQPYAEPAGALAATEQVTLPEGLAAASETGAPTLVNLRARYPDAAHAAIRASIVARAGDGVLARSRAFLQAQVASRSLTPQEGSDPDAVLSRMDEALRAGDLPAVLAEAEALPSEAAAAMEDWLADARLRAEAEAGLAELQSGLSAIN